MTLEEKVGQVIQANIALSCFTEAGSNIQEVGIPFLIAAEAGLVIQLSEIKIVNAENSTSCKL